MKGKHRKRRPGKAAKHRLKLAPDTKAVEVVKTHAQYVAGLPQVPLR